MEQRRSKRKLFIIKTVIISGGRSFEGVIGNISAEGVYMRIEAVKVNVDLKRGEILELKFQPIPGETLNLHCMIKMTELLPMDRTTSGFGIGMEIIDPPLKYKEFYLSLE
ncbi:MAG: PilZ domain-containing protein [Thermodesulfovibrionia bacterium]|nr:PilZ domain-containing protein [Thermodesulfovibrionia bacterium]